MTLSITPTQTPPRSPWIVPVLLTMGAAGVSQGFARFTFAIVLPDMTADLLGSYSAAGILGAANLGGYLAGVILMTTSSWRVENTRLLKVGLAATIAGLLIVAIAPSYLLLLVGMGIAGISSAAVWIPCASIVSAHVAIERRGLALGLSTAGIGVSIALAGRIVAVVHDRFGPGAWRQVWAIEVALALVVLVLVLLFLRPIGRVDETRPARINVRRALPGATALFACYGIYGLGYILYTSYLIAALQDDAGYEPSHAALMYSSLGLASIVGGVVIGRASDLIGRRPMLIITMVAVAACSLAIPFGRQPWIVISAVSFGVLMTGAGTVVAAYVSDHLEPKDIGTAFAAITLSLSSAQLIGPPIGGWLADASSSFALTYILAAVAGVVAALMAALLPRERRSRRHAEPTTLR